MRCQACNAENPHGRRYCAECGGPLPACESCGFHNEIHAKFCGGCGRKLALLSATATQPETSGLAGETETSKEAERRQITVMFCDLVGSTALSVSLDPEDMREVIRSFQSAAGDAIARHGGFVARYMGDGVMVYFGYPQAAEDDAQRALRAGLEIIAAVECLHPLPDVALQVRVGVATGLVVVGDRIGDGMSREEAVVGTTPNLAARLLGLAEPGSMVISRTTRRLVGDLFDCRDLGSHRLKGFDEPVPAWRVWAERAMASRFEANHPGTELAPLIGREQEFRVLLDAWSKTREGGGQIVTVRGDPGIGKSRLTQALREHVAGEPHVILRYFCAPRFQNTALFPVIEQLQRAARFHKDDPDAAKLDKLERLLARSDSSYDAAETVPYVAALLSIPIGDRYPAISVTPERQKERTLQALVAQLVGFARHEPVLMLFEDVHWADSTSLLLLERLVGEIAGYPVLIVATSRPEFEPPWTAAPCSTNLDIERLGMHGCRQMIDKLAGGRALPKQVLDQILEKSDGVPLFVEEITKAVLESGLMEEAAGRYVLTGPLPRFAVPSTLQDSLMARLDRLDDAKEVAQVGAAIGRQFSLDLLAAVCDLPEHELQRAVQRLADSDLIECRGLSTETICMFKHVLVQDAAHATMLRGRRRSLHGRIAAALESGFPQTVATAPELVAHHFTEAHLAEKAVPYWQQAGVLASSRAAYTEAIGHFRAAVALIEGLPQDATRDQLELGVRVNLGLSLSAARGYAAPEVEQAYERARELCHLLGDTSDLYPVLRGLCTFYIVRDQLTAARELAEQCLRLGEQTRVPAYLIEGYTALGYTLVYQGEIGSGEALLEKGLEVYRANDGQRLQYPTTQDPAVSDLSLLALVAWMRGDGEASLRASREALALAQALDRPFDRAYAHCFAAMLHNMRLEAQAAATHAQRAIELSVQHGFDVWLAAGSMHAAMARGALGETAQAIGVLTATLAAWAAAGAELNRCFFQAGLAQIYMASGQLDDALHSIGEAIDHAARHEEHFYDAVLYRLRGDMRIARGGKLADQGENDLRRALEIARSQGSRLFELEALASLHARYASSGRDAPYLDELRALCGQLSRSSPESVAVRQALALVAGGGRQAR